MTRHKLEITDNWKAFLADVDAALSQKFTLRCLGGFVLAAKYDLSRRTADIDYIEVTPPDKEDELKTIAGPQSKLAQKHKLYIHKTTVSTYPDGFESRLEMLDLGLQKIELRVLGPYDLVLSKICTTRTKDTEDAKYLIKAAALNVEVFMKIWKSEMEYQIPSHY